MQKMHYSPRTPTGPDDFHLLKIIGKGGFGKVFQVRGKLCEKIYAMKVVDIPEHEKEQEHLRTEIKVLKSVKSPFLCKMSYCFETKQQVFIILDFMHGGEMFRLLNRKGCLTETDAKFYAAELVLALGHLHENEVIYRDLKMENVLIDKHGHVKLADFGLSKCNIAKGKTTNSFCGTYETMAPEIILRQDYGHGVDVWALGCLIHDMIVGGSPFAGETNDEIVDNIMNKPLKLLDFSKECRNLLLLMLKRRVNSRIEIEKIKEHAFFNGVNWDSVSAQSTLPPFKPKISSDDDVSYFDPAYTDLPAMMSPSKVQSTRSADNIDNTTSFINFEYKEAYGKESKVSEVLEADSSPKQNNPKRRRQK